MRFVQDGRIKIGAVSALINESSKESLDPKVVSQAAKGDMEAAEDFIKYFLPRFRNLARYFLPDDEAVDVLAKRAVVDALRRLGAYNSELDGRIENLAYRMGGRYIRHLAKRYWSAARPKVKLQYSPVVAPEASPFNGRRLTLRALDEFSSYQRDWS